MWGEIRLNVFILECLIVGGRVVRLRRWERWEVGEIGNERKVGVW